MKNMNITHQITFILTVLLSATLVAAQSKAKPATADQDSKTRTRRASVVGPSGEKVPAAEAEKPKASKAVEESEQASESKEEQSPAPTQKAVPVDPIVALREEISAAPTISEKVRLQFELVDLLMSKGSRQEAINELRLMANEERFDPQGFYNIGNAQARLNDSEGAITTYQKAISQRKGRYSKALNNLGVVMLRLGRWDEAYEAFNSALKLEHFRYAEASYNLGRLYSARGENDLAVREWKRAVIVNPEHSAASQALKRAGSGGIISVATLPTRSSPEKVKKQPEHSPTVQPVKAERAARPMTLTVDHDSYNYLQRARDARERGRHQEAITNYKQVISRMGGYFAPANLEMSYALITLRRADEAIDNLESVTEHDGDRYPISYYHLARLYETKGDFKRAEENYAKAANSYSQNNAQFLLDVSRVREKVGDLQGALAAFEEYVAAMERQNLKPQWSEDRMSALKQKVLSAREKP